MFDAPIFIYSDYCNYCTKFIELIIQYPDIQKQIRPLNIDPDPTTQKRPQPFYDIQNQLNITEVPTLILENGNRILSGKDVFNWLEVEISNTEQGIEGFNSNEMTSFSDMYAPLSGDSNAKEQSFKFLNKPDIVIQTPLDEQNTQLYDRPKQKLTRNTQSKQNEIDKRLRELELERENTISKPPPPKKVNFATGHMY